MCAGGLDMKCLQLFDYTTTEYVFDMLFKNNISKNKQKKMEK